MTHETREQFLIFTTKYKTFIQFKRNELHTKQNCNKPLSLKFSSTIQTKLFYYNLNPLPFRCQVTSRLYLSIEFSKFILWWLKHFSLGPKKCFSQFWIYKDQFFQRKFVLTFKQPIINILIYNFYSINLARIYWSSGAGDPLLKFLILKCISIII